MPLCVCTLAKPAAARKTRHTALPHTPLNAEGRPGGVYPEDREVSRARAQTRGEGGAFKWWAAGKRGVEKRGRGRMAKAGGQMRQGNRDVCACVRRRPHHMAAGKSLCGAVWCGVVCGFLKDIRVAARSPFQQGRGRPRGQRRCKQQVIAQWRSPQIHTQTHARVCVCVCARVCMCVLRVCVVFVRCRKNKNKRDRLCAWRRRALAAAASAVGQRPFSKPNGGCGGGGWAQGGRRFKWWRQVFFGVAM
jgi:hypothetical protein